MSEFNSYVDFLQMEQLDKQQRYRKKMLWLGQKKLKNMMAIAFNIERKYNPNFWVYGILAKNKIKTIKNLEN